MNINSSLKYFVEKYDNNAITSIHNISNQLGLNANRFTIQGFNLKESFKEFKDFLEKYANYKKENKENEKSTPQNLICESVKNNIKNELFTDSPILYKDLPLFVESYIEGIKDTINTVDKLKKDMFMEDLDYESIADINTFTDYFIEELDQRFHKTMDKILWASGYNTNKILFSKTPKKDNKCTFL